MLVKPVKFGRRARRSGEIPCTHIAIEEHLAEDQVTLVSVVIEICGGPPDAPKRIHLPNDADEFYVMDDKGDHQNSYKWKRMLEASLEERRRRSRAPVDRFGVATSEAREAVRS